MRNPLNRRLPRELKHDLGKYAVIFLFLVMLISLVSGFLVADNSVRHAYDEGFEKYNLEWGHVSFNQEPSAEFLETLEDENDILFYDLSYFEKNDTDHAANIRVYADREIVNTECLMSGNMPMAGNEIALDRMYAQNAGIELQDTIRLGEKELTVTGFIALPDYSCLFENNSDMMFDSIHFGVGVMSSDAFYTQAGEDIIYNYAWKYNNLPASDKKEKEASDKLKESLAEELIAYDTELAMKGEPVLEVTDFLPRYLNKSINFTGEDMSSDKAMFLVFDYIVVAILAFVFAITISNTITEEAGVIGTLRAMGYTRGELVRHYLVLPLIVSFLAAVIGNILGYTVMKDYMVGIYYNSYSLSTFELLFNAEAFLDTTVIPLLLMFVINLVVLSRKMRISPLQFLRRETTKKAKQKPIRLNTKIPFIQRFRLRILLQNIPNYLILFVGIMFAAVIFIFGSMMMPLVKEYSRVVSDSKLAEYQYVLKQPVETDNAQAEKYCVTSLHTLPGKYMEDELMVYGVEEDSKYISEEIPEGKVLASNGTMDKYSLKVGDVITLRDPFSDEEYEFEIAGEYVYDGALSLFMGKTEFNTLFDKEPDYFTGYFTNEKLSDVEDKYVASIVDVEDLKKIATQLEVSMGDFMILFEAFGVFMFLLMMYILSKQIIEKNAKSISIVKILGFRNGEIGGLYVVATSIVVVLSLFLTILPVQAILTWVFKELLYTMMTGYIPMMIKSSLYVKMVIVGILSYAVVAVVQMVKINKIPKSDALKNVE